MPVEPSKGDSADMDTFVDLTGMYYRHLLIVIECITFGIECYLCMYTIIPPDSKDVLKISSSDEECDVPDSSCNSQSSQPRGNSSQKRKKLKHPKEIVKNAK